MPSRALQTTMQVGGLRDAAVTGPGEIFAESDADRFSVSPA
ncbi:MULTISPECIES: hypothetical protein [unclassified Mycolicibacterium]